MVEGYQRRHRAAGVYFRELYSLTYNVNRDPKTDYLSPMEVLLLPGEKRPRKSAKRTQGGGYTFEQMAEAARKASTPVTTLTSWPEQ